ncbi:MAG: pyridoxamine 5'-phosphate oxidase family protein [Leptolyngbya sp. SIO4C1]|nr:pyridoxamine 5'-phosphate oxidase family protein [Leptolyngbya sp. SIO4C1]
MAKVYDQITPDLQAFIERQPLFFVATAPLAAAGHVNLSPKGLDALSVLSPTQVAYLDLTGSGNETSAHIHENGRITLMFCAFTGKPLILRLFGQGRTVLPTQPDWNLLIDQFPHLPGGRQLIVVEVERVQTSCGMGVPLFEYQGQRQALTDWAQRKGPEGLAQYQRQKGSTSLDGLVTPIGLEQVAAKAD